MGIRTYPDVPRVYFDFDDTLADYSRGAREAGIDPKDFKRVAGAYLHLHPMPGAIEAVNAVIAMGYLPFGLTKIPAANPFAATEKLLWAPRAFPALGERIIISPDKGAVGLPRDFLVEDHPEWANANNFPGEVLHFTGDWTPILARLAEAALRSHGIARSAEVAND